ncbi:MAG: EthD family reductase [Pseudomonadota bacterium]
MFKAMIILKRSPDLSFEAFKSHWTDVHAPLVKTLPGLQKAVFNMHSGEGDGEIDAISELWFESEQAFESAYSSETGQKVAADSLAKVCRRERFIATEILVL